MSAKLLMIVGDFVEDYEAKVPYQALEMVGHEVHAACPERGDGGTVKTAIHDFRGDQTYLEERGRDLPIDVALEDVDSADYGGLVVPGGRAPEYLRTYEVVLDTVRHFFEADKPVATLCHGPQILAAADVLDGRDMTSYPAVRAEVEAAGCSWVDGVIALLFVVLLLVGGVGEVAAHNPAGQPVPGCENGGDAAAHSNPNCHG